MKNLSDYIKEASNDEKEYVYAVKDEFGSIIQMLTLKKKQMIKQSLLQMKRM